MRRLGRYTKYHEMGWPIRRDANSPYTELRLPGAPVRLLDQRVHRKALEDAGRKLSELLRRSGSRHSS